MTTTLIRYCAKQQKQLRSQIDAHRSRQKLSCGLILALSECGTDMKQKRLNSLEVRGMRTIRPEIELPAVGISQLT